MSKTATATALVQVAIREWIITLALIFGGCCSNVFALESLVRQEPKSGSLITFFQFLFVSMYGLLNHLEFRSGWLHLKERKVPLRSWIVMVALFWSVNVLNNYALGFHISMPFHIIFRSGSILVTMGMGMLFFKRSFTSRQITAVLIVTVGIIISSFASAKSRTSSQHQESDALEFLYGITILVIALVLSCLLGQYQQHIYTTYGKHWEEGLFYMHFLGLPIFLLQYHDIYSNIILYNASKPIPLIGMLEHFLPYSSLIEILNVALSSSLLKGIVIPELWLYLGLNTLTQFVCINGVAKLTSFTTSVTVNLVLALRKFVSLFLSIVIFRNSFEIENWVGTVLVFLGTLLYSFAK